MTRPGTRFALLAVVVATMSACSGGDGSSVPSKSPEPSTTTTTTTPPDAVTNAWSAPGSVDPRALPIGDGKRSTTQAAIGAVFACQAGGGGGGASVDGPWIHGTTWDSTAKTAVQGAVTWPSASYSVTVAGKTRTITTNDLPTHEETGLFPIASSDPAYAYDRNPNRISPHATTISLPTNPAAASTPGCVPGGAIGILANGVYLFNALDAPGRDAVAHETQDRCDGHPAPGDQYHYHDVPSCIRNVATGTSTLVGWAYDGYPIYVERDSAGNLPTNADLDECHGRTSRVLMDGAVVTTYHYSATLEYPYTIGCFHGTSTATSPRP
jgi:YHYH protein